jgi:sulfur-carrier protein adenylyltransferase/sulfurtransferase
MNKETLFQILEKGILAPSGDNTQPWQFKLRESGVDVYLTSGWHDHFFEAGNRSLHLSAGAVIENMKVAAAHFGFDTSIHYFPEKNDGRFVAALDFQRAAGLSNGYFEFLDKRCTNRKFYKSSLVIEDDIVSKLHQLSDNQKIQLHSVKRGDPRFKKLAKMIGQADQMRFEMKKTHVEFVSTLRFDRKEAEKKRDGIDVKTLEVGPKGLFGGLFFKWIGPWQRLKLMNWLGLSRQMNIYSRLQLAGTQMLGFVSAPTYSSQDFVHGGEMVERMWLELTRQGLAMQPMDTLMIFFVNLQLNGGKDFTPAQRKKVEGWRDEFCKMFSVLPNSGFIFLFRAGHAGPPSARSLRKPVESFLIPTA